MCRRHGRRQSCFHLQVGCDNTSSRLCCGRLGGSMGRKRSRRMTGGGWTTWSHNIFIDLNSNTNGESDKQRMSQSLHHGPSALRVGFCATDGTIAYCCRLLLLGQSSALLHLEDTNKRETRKQKASRRQKCASAHLTTPPPASSAFSETDRR